MNILVLSFYFSPDLSAGSFRTTALVGALKERMPPGSHIDVITTLPNRYRTFSREAPEVERGAGLEIRRISLPPHRSDMRGQSQAFWRFSREAQRHAARRHYDVVFATSSRLMTATLGASIARRQRTRLYLDIRDIFVETIVDVLPSYAGWPIRKVFSAVESWTLRSADRINFVSRGFEEYFRPRYPRATFSWFSNGVDEEFVPDMQAPARKTAGTGLPTIVYAGNIGESQALHAILPGLAGALQGRARFVVIGDGGRRAVLANALRSAGYEGTVELRDPLPRAELVQAYGAADILFLHLGAQPAFERVLPSKLFEYAALGKPILAGVGGYAARFIADEVSNAAVFPPCDVTAGVAAFERLEVQDTPRLDFIAKYRRSNIARALADEIIALGSAPRQAP